jgi:hypothetical protein
MALAVKEVTLKKLRFLLGCFKNRAVLVWNPDAGTHCITTKSMDSIA